MGNLNREIDLMLERSQRRYECLDQQIDLMLEGSLSEYVRAVDLTQSAIEDSEGTPQKNSPIADGLKLLLGSEDEKILAAGELLGKLLLAKEKSKILQKINIGPNEEEVKRIIWMLELWEKIPLQFKAALAKEPRTRIAVIALDKYAKRVKKALLLALKRKGERPGTAPVDFQVKSWTKKLRSSIPNLPEVKESLTEANHWEPLLREDKLTTITIDFSELRKQELNESFLAMFGGWIEYILGAMFGGRSLPLSVKGSRREVESFAKAIGGEKKYLEVVRRYGLDHPTTYKNKAKLDNAIKGFERETGLKWPFK